MMGRLKSDQGRLFCEFRLGDAVPEDHMVRKIDAALASWRSVMDKSSALASARSSAAPPPSRPFSRALSSTCYELLVQDTSVDPCRPKFSSLNRDLASRKRMPGRSSDACTPPCLCWRASEMFYLSS